jgi:hypothetical protein
MIDHVVSYAMNALAARRQDARSAVAVALRVLWAIGDYPRAWALRDLSHRLGLPGRN